MENKKYNTRNSKRERSREKEVVLKNTAKKEKVIKKVKEPKIKYTITLISNSSHILRTHTANTYCTHVRHR